MNKNQYFYKACVFSGLPRSLSFFLFSFLLSFKLKLSILLTRALEKVIDMKSKMYFAKEPFCKSYKRWLQPTKQSKWAKTEFSGEFWTADADLATDSMQISACWEERAVPEVCRISPEVHEQSRTHVTCKQSAFATRSFFINATVCFTSFTGYSTILVRFTECPSHHKGCLHVSVRFFC